MSGESEALLLPESVAFGEGVELFEGHSWLTARAGA